METGSDPTVTITGSNLGIGLPGSPARCGTTSEIPSLH